LISKLRRNLRERGVRGTAGRALSRLREGYTKEELIVLLKTTDSIVEPKKPGKLTMEDLGSAHLPELIELNRKAGEPLGADKYFENSLKLGYHGFIARIDGELVGYYWWVDRDDPNPHSDVWRLGKQFELEPGDVYGSSLFLLEEHRGGGTANDFLYKIEAGFRDRGYKRIWGYVVKDNRPARWTYNLRGYKPTWNMVNRRLVFFRWRRSSPIE
jgi:GNAT superfamily N-acetyltransferase